ncbi:hypothetical protein [Bradyrhizobium sp. ISRA464]|uniref:hypothetical protein n=1 Tax=Bradyrhizobium sp. ISRA464 TaxID=2866200 RepID=UPI002479BF46|nr:hypothetical protein [Bradyrhizobium sp. ISRA464]WGS31537.1 hypothetical protein MTX19_27030 [Bradyrhizobium sp. ISRA464]
MTALRCASRSAIARPSVTLRDALEALIGKLGVGDRSLAEETPRIGLAPRPPAGKDPLPQQLIHQNVDAAQEEARDRGNTVNGLASFQAALERSHICFCDGLAIAAISSVRGSRATRHAAV